MAVVPFEHADEASAALREIVAEYGPEALSRPATVANLLKDLLPDTPKVARIVIAAAEDHVADMLREHVSQGMDAVTAGRLTASAFADATMFTPEACSWVVGAFSGALGLSDRSPTIVVSAQHAGREAARRPQAAPSGGAGRAVPAVAAQTAAMAYVTAFGDGTVIPIDLSSRTAHPPIRVGSSPGRLRSALTELPPTSLTPVTAP